MLNLPAGRDLVERLGLRMPHRRAPSGSPRIAVLGNCQASAIGRAMRLLCPGAEVRFVSAGTLGRNRLRPDQLVMDLSGFDVVFAQRITSRHLGPEHYAALAERGKGFRPVPAFVFAAFHPDLVYVGGPGTRNPAFVDSPVGHYHSALALYGYLAGLTADETIRLFRREVYEHLGYLDLWGYAQETLVALGRDAGMDLEGAVVRWARRGCFMHSVNHPKMFVLVDIAKMLLEAAGLPFRDDDLESLLIDDLSLKGMWPVYDPVARHYGVPGSMMFQAQALDSRSRKPGQVFTLADFVAGSFERYRALPRSALASDRVETWLTSDQLGAAFRSWAA